MQRCPACATEAPPGATTCPECGATLVDEDPGTAAPYPGVDPEEEAERFERRYGIDIGDRTVDEFLRHLERQDYSLSAWFWLVVAAELAGVVLFAAALVVSAASGRPVAVLFGVTSVVLALGVHGDTRAVGQFDRWARIRWTYVLLAAVPVAGHVAGALYLLMRRLKREQTATHREHLLNAGFDLDVAVHER